MIPYHQLAIICFAALIHASFQLSVSVLTLISEHSLGRQAGHRRLNRLIGGFIAGTGIMTLLLLSLVILAAQLAFGHTVPLMAWAVTSGSLLGLGVAVWAFYYRRSAGISLWLPRSFARYLEERAKDTHYSTEAFSLGLTSLVAELLFIAAPLIVGGFVILELPNTWHPVGLLAYIATSLLSLLVVGGIIGSGHKISSVQHWRENNKRFLQFAAGSGLMLLSIYVYINQVFGGAL